MSSAQERLLFGGVCVMLSACGPPAGERAEDVRRADAVAVETRLDLGVPERANGSVSAASAGAFVVVAWAAAAADGLADVYAAVSRDAGRTFAAPVRVNDETGSVRVSGEQPPRVALGSEIGGAPVISIIWTALGTPGTRLLTARSTDGGRSFHPSTPVEGVEAPGNRGWESLAAFADGRVVAAWLDHRQHAAGSNAEATHDQHDAGTVDGVAMAQRSQLFFAPFGGEPRALTGGVCYCCKTALGTGVLGAPDTIAVAWRHVYPGNLRDIAFMLSRDGGATFGPPIRVSEDQWALTGCPDDGPAMAADESGHVHLVWPTAITEEGETRKVLVHASTGDGMSFSSRVRLPTQGQANHPQVAVTVDGRLVGIWDESGDGSRWIALAVARPAPHGTTTFVRGAWATRESGVYPVLAPAADGLVAAWTSGAAASSRITVVRLRL